MAAVTARLGLVLALLLGVALAGCGDDDDDAGGYSALTARVENHGTSPLSVPLTVASEGREVLQRTVRVPGAGHTDVEVPDLRAAPATVSVRYDHTEGTQTIHGSREHVLRGNECPEQTVLVTFSFLYTSGSGRQEFANHGSTGACQA